ncbi:MAG: hypothetical protein CR982_05470 [Candidatus Cloacimonadota bacterium]|nr:MAG: hypothetical protein CR982_05470 [Candidatus Cloacimonadota bacterium]PIE77583.1 MAG: hypothetical protein CSA15_12155 [Candidatus Delongbacteria bacterium]
MDNKIKEAEDFIIYDYKIPFSTRLQKQFFWPVYRYKVSISGFSFGVLNLFEYFMLKFIASAGKDKLKLKSLTGMQEDLIDFLQQKLTNKGYLDDNFYINKKGLSILSEIDEKENEENLDREPYFFYIYIDSFTKNILPVIIPIEEEKVIQSTITQEGKSLIVFEKQSSVGKQNENDTKKIWAFDFPQNYNSDINKEEVEQLVIKSMKDGKIPYQENFKVETIEESAEKVYLAVHFILQEGNTKKWLITEGFSSDFSTIFNPEYLNDAGKEEVTKSRDYMIHKSLNIPDKIQETMPNDIVEKLTPYYQYPQIFEKLKQIEISKAGLDKIGKIDTSDKQEESKNKKKDLISNLYQVMEWSFFHSAKNIQGKNSILKELKNKSPLEIKDKSLKIMKKHKLDIIEKYKNNLKVKYGSIEYSLKEDSDKQLIPLLVFHIIAESERFIILMNKNPQLINDFILFTYLRNPAEHNENINIKQEQIDLYYDTCYSVLEFLFPTLKSSKDIISKNFYFFTETESQIHKKRFMAQKVVEEKLGFGLQNKLAPDIYQDMVNIEKFFINSDQNNINPNIIKNLYNIFDKIFMHINQNISTPQKIIKVNECLEKANSVGFDVDRNELKSFERINKERLQKAVENKPVSLQSSFLVFLFKIDKKILRKISKEMSNLLFIINNISNLRGHGDILIIKQKKGALLQNTIRDAHILLYDFTKKAYNLNII